MPFTFSHPAIVLPLACLPCKWFSLTGLVIGSMTPDFEYFIRMRIKSIYSHTWDGLFWFDLPLGLLLAFLFHNVVRDSLFNNLPSFFRSRFTTFQLFNWNEYFRRNWLIVMASILIGAASHILWDGFTHESGFFVKMMPSLSNNINVFEKQISVFKLCQHSSSLFGGILLAFAIYNLPITNLEKQKVNMKYWYFVFILSITIILTRLLLGLELHQIGNVIVTSISATLISLVLAPLMLSKLNS
jgi:hypothetical protein